MGGHLRPHIKEEKGPVALQSSKRPILKEADGFSRVWRRVLRRRRGGSGQLESAHGEAEAADAQTILPGVAGAAPEPTLDRSFSHRRSGLRRTARLYTRTSENWGHYWRGGGQHLRLRHDWWRFGASEERAGEGGRGPAARILCTIKKKKKIKTNIWNT